MTVENNGDTSDIAEDPQDQPESTPLNEAELSWEAIDLTETSREAVSRMGFDKPTEVQQKAIPRVHAGVDLIVQAKTGSGKTLAFGLPILEMLDPKKAVVQALVLTPTRELAMQVSEEITQAGALGNKSVVPVYGGASMNVQISRIKDGAQIVVGTPGRILDHINRRTLKLDDARMVVLDEADEMLDRGFLPDVMKILGFTPHQKQTMLFSATIPPQIKHMAESYLRDPETIMIGKAGMSINLDIHHTYYRTDKLYKFVSLINILHSLPWTRVLIFCNQKSDTERVAQYLHEEGFAVGFLSGDLSQSVRNRTLDMFKNGVIDLMVATDVAARGIDIYGVSHVINFDLPENKERYLHRTGRTGRAGRKGEAVSIVAPAELLAIGTIQRSMGVTFEQLPVPTKEDVQANLKSTFIERLRAMEEDGYPDDIALFADEVLEKIDSYAITAGLLTLLRQRGWEIEHGYDPDNPELRDRNYVRPKLLGIADIEARRDRNVRRESGDRRGNRGAKPNRRNDKRNDSREGKSQRSRQSENNDKTEKPKRKYARKVWATLSLGENQDLAAPADIVSLVCQTGGVRKTAVGKIEVGEDSSRFQIAEDMAMKVVEAFERRKKEPLATVALDSPITDKEEKTEVD